MRGLTEESFFKKIKEAHPHINWIFVGYESGLTCAFDKSYFTAEQIKGFRRWERTINASYIMMKGDSGEFDLIKDPDNIFVQTEDLHSIALNLNSDDVNNRIMEDLEHQLRNFRYMSIQLEESYRSG